jgi:carbon-monoxide dehydrogenase medium subunit
MQAFEYLNPASVDEAVSFLVQHKEEARILAGGQSLLPMLVARLLFPRYLVGLQNMRQLGSIERFDDGLRIGAMATLRQLIDSPLVHERAPLLSRAASLVASPAIRNVGTLGGNLAHNLVGSDPPPALMVLNASAVIVGSSGERRVPIEAFFRDYMETELRNDEMLVYIDVPDQKADVVWDYKKCRRRAEDPAIVGVAVALTMQGGICNEARIAIGGVGPIPLRSLDAEQILEKRYLEDSLVHEAARAAAAPLEPLADSRASSDYRRKMVEVYTRRALKSALEGR